MDEPENWPRRSFGKVVEKLRSDTIEVDVAPKSDIEDVTLHPSVDKEIIQNAPIIDVVGSELQTELRSRIWGGILTRVLERENPEDGRRERCFQYLYLFTHQKGGVSYFWNIIVPILTLLFAYFSDIIFPESIYNQSILVLIVCIPLWLLPIMQHVTDWRDQNKTAFHIRGTTLLLPFGAASWFTVFYHNSTPGETMFYTASEIVYWGLVLFLLILVLERFLCVFGIGITCHRMDYAPIFLYQDDTGTIESACWDYYHYNAVFEDQMEDLVDKKNRVRLIMADAWHSFSQKRFINKKPVTLIGLILIFIGVAEIVWMYMNSLSADILAIGLLFFITGFIFVVQLPIGGKNFTDFSDMAEPGYLEKRGSITQNKLIILWNLKDQSARLKITESLQDPFHFRLIRKKSFNDIDTEEAQIVEHDTEEDVVESQATLEIEPEEERAEENPLAEKAPPSAEDLEDRDPRRLRIDSSRRLGHRPEDYEE